MSRFFLFGENCGIMYLSFVQWISAWTFIEEKRRKPDEAFIRIRFF